MIDRLTMILARTNARSSLLAVLATAVAPACGPEKMDETTAASSGATTEAETGGMSTAPMTSSNPTTGNTPTSDPTSPQTTLATEAETTATTASTASTATTATTTNPDDAQLCMNLGGFGGVQALVGDFVARVLVDERINAYFLTTDVDGGKLSSCLVEQIGAATGCDGVAYACGDMQSVHAGMGISMSDFNDLAEDFSQAMDAHQQANPALSNDDKSAILGVLGSMAPDIVEDPGNNTTTYQRLGRKPGIATVIGGPEDPKSFIALVAGDASIVSFFAASDLARLKTCLVRQVTTATSGPPIYGKEVTAPVPADPGVSTEKPCLDMKSSHATLKDGMGVGIEYLDFNVLVGHLITAMTNYSVPLTDQNAILGALAPLCADIVTVNPAMCG